MREIGGYIELDKYELPMLHEGAVELNCARNCLAYLIRARNIKKILVPRFLCDSVKDVCIRENVQIKYYGIDYDFRPVDIMLYDDEWLYIVNYYGQLDNTTIEKLAEKYSRIIIDNVQAYFQMPTEDVDTLYTCRKFFGVSDGAFLYTDARINEEIPRDESFERMGFLLGRFERTAEEFYCQYSDNNSLFANESIKRMSKLTKNLLHGINYTSVGEQRTKNFRILHDEFQQINKLRLSVPYGAFMYPLYISNGADVRKKLISKKIYIPMLWPEVAEGSTSELERDMAENILPLPCDQRYGIHEMKYIINEINNILKKKM